MPTKRVLRDMLHAEQERCARVLKRRNEVGDMLSRVADERDALRSELAEVRRTHLAPWECELLHAPWECELLHAGEVDTLAKERDSARTVAVRLEQENALLTASLKAYADAFGAIGTEFRAAAIATHQLLAGGQA